MSTQRCCSRNNTFGDAVFKKSLLHSIKSAHFVNRRSTKQTDHKIYIQKIESLITETKGGKHQWRVSSTRSYSSSLTSSLTGDVTWKIFIVIAVILITTTLASLSPLPFHSTNRETQSTAPWQRRRLRKSRLHRETDPHA